MKGCEILKMAKIPASALAALAAFEMASSAAYTQRGYAALGGELFVVPVAFLLSAWFFDWAIRVFRAMERRNGAHGRKAG